MIKDAGLNYKKKVVWALIQTAVGDKKLEIPFSRLKNAPIRKVKLKKLELDQDLIRITNTLQVTFTLKEEDFETYRGLAKGQNKQIVRNKLIKIIKELMLKNKVGVRELASLHNTSPARIIEALGKKRSEFKIDRLMDICESLGVGLEVNYVPTKNKFFKF